MTAIPERDDGIWVGHTSAGTMLWVFDPAIPHPDLSKVYGFALHAGEMREYPRRQVSSYLLPIRGAAAGAAVAEYLRWKEAKGAMFLLDEERRRKTKATDAKRTAAEAERLRGERVRRLVLRMRHRQAGDLSEIRRLVAEREIQFLVHFTRTENLAGIVEHGIMPRAILTQEFHPNDAMRLDGFPEASSLSLGFPNYLMFYRYRCIYPNANWAVIFLPTDVLVDVPCLFFPTNAANGKFRNANDDAIEHKMGVEGLAALFSDQPPGVREERGLPARASTDPQAEVLAFSTIAPERIRAVRLLRHDPDTAALLRGRLPLAKVAVGGKHFERRADYRFWQTWARPSVPETAPHLGDIPF